MKASIKSVRLLNMGITPQGINGLGFDDSLEVISSTVLNV